MKKSYLIFLLLLVFPVAIMAQTTPIKGVVVSAGGEEALAGVSISLKGTSRAVFTAADGTFELQANSSDILVVQYIGFITQELPVGATRDFRIVMSEDTRLLDEVVVIGYGVQKKSVVTAAISRVSSEDLAAAKPSRIEDVLKGKVSGVQITQNSGQPGAGSKVQIRGLGTFNNYEPLYIIDGMAVDGGIRNLNPADVESVEILKDAASAAIYGTRGANGVILVTTKKGLKGKATVNYDFSFGWQNPWKKKEVLDAKEYMILMNEQGLNDGISTPRFTAQQIANAKTTDWQEEVFNWNAPVKNHQVSLNGGNDKVTYYLSFGYFNQEGIIGGDYGKSNYERYTLRLNNTYTAYEDTTRDFLNKLHFTSNVTYARATSTGITENTEYGSILGSALAFAPTLPVYAEDPDAVLTNYPTAVTDKDGRVFTLPPTGYQELANPVAMLNRPSSDLSNEDKIIASVMAELSIWDGLKFKSSYSADLAFWGSDGYTYPYYLSAQGNYVTNSTVYSEMNRGYTWQWENYFSYDKSFGDHTIGAVLGQSARKATTRYLRGSGQNLETTDPNKAWIDRAMADPTTQRARGNIGNATFYALASYFFRIDYNYAERYIIQATLRYDGSTRFGANNKWASFPAVSVGWNIMNEAFMQDLNLTWLNALKLRASWGKNGNDRFTDLRYAAFYDSGTNYYFGGAYQIGGTAPGGTMYNGMTSGALANPDLQWEASEQIDIGLELRALNSRLSFGFDWYSKKTNGLLLEQPIPSYVGKGRPWCNLGNMKNWGVEFELGWKDRVGQVNYYANANLSFMKNELVRLNGTSTIISNIDGAGAGGVGEFSRASLGMPYPYFYGYKTDGILQTPAEAAAYNLAYGLTTAQPGDVRFVDLNGDGAIDSDDRTMIGKGMPDWVLGFSLGADYKGFDINMFFYGTFGNDMFDFAQRADITSMNRPAWMLDRWHGEGTSNRIPRMTTSGIQNWRSSDLYIKDGSYLRLKTIQLGYTLPAEYTKKIAVQKLRLFITADNLFTFTGYDGYDVEIAAGTTSIGVDKGIYPQSRTISIGANITF